MKGRVGNCRFLPIFLRTFTHALIITTIPTLIAPSYPFHFSVTAIPKHCTCSP